MKVPFVRVLGHLESRGWELDTPWGTRHVFRNRKQPSEPIIVRVKDRKVDDENFQKIRRIVEEEGGGT